MSADRLSIFHQHRPLLFSIAYRMLGSVMDAEDIVQEAFIRWERTDREGIRSPRSFLVTVVTRLCLNELQSARVRREEYVGPWLPEPLPTAGSTEGELRLDESLSIAFLVLLEQLSPAERAVFLLREVFDLDYADVAATLETSAANCRQLLHRARVRIAAGRPRFKPSKEQRRRLLETFSAAARDGDLEGLRAVLAEDVVCWTDGGGKARAALRPVFGVAAVMRFILGSLRKFVPADQRSEIGEINGEAAVVTRRAEDAISVLTLDVADHRIQAIYIITNPDKLRRLAGSSGAQSLKPPPPPSA